MSLSLIRSRAAAWLLAALVLLAGNAFAAAPHDEALQSKLISLPSGITLNYVVQGDPHGPVVLLLHGAGDSWHSFERVLPLLPASLRVYAITLRGHGLSDHPAQGFGRDDFAGDIAQFIDQLKLDQVTLVGHSLGSFVAQTLVEHDQQHHIARLVLIGSAPDVPADPAVRTAIKQQFSSLQDPIDYRFARDFQASTIAGQVPAWFFETMVAQAQLAPAATWHGLANSLTQPAPANALKAIQIPTLLLWGDQDSIFHRPEQDALLHALAHAQLKVYAGTGHALHWEQPQRFSRDLLAFIHSSAP